MMFPKDKALRDEKYLLHLRTQPCLISGLYAHDGESVVPCHIGTRGRGIKSDDSLAFPLLNRFHVMQPEMGEISMYRKHLPDYVFLLCLKAYARELYREYKESR